VIRNRGKVKFPLLACFRKMPYGFFMRRWLAFLLCLAAMIPTNSPALETTAKKVYVIPIRDDIIPPLVYLVRRGVKEAMANKADVLIIDMDTNGGRVDVTEEIIEILNQFKGETVTYVNRKAFSAGAFISFATQKIYMAPQSVIGAAAPIMLSPDGGGAEAMPDTVEAKMSSAISALVRANAEKNGHNVEVADAMVKKTKELKIDGKVLNEKGQILTLTDQEAKEEYGTPPKPLLSDGTVENFSALLKELNLDNATVKKISASGVEKLGTWINAISPLLLIIGVIGCYIEYKTPGFGLPGIVGITAFAIYFFGGYIAALSGAEWIAIFIIGLALLASELFVHPGTILPGLIGGILILVSLIMATVDIYPGVPSIPTMPQLRVPLQEVGVALLISFAIVIVLMRYLPKTPLYGALVSQTASGVGSDIRLAQKQTSREGQIGVAISALRPGGKAQFGDEIVDVMTQGDLIPKGQKVKIIGHSGTEAIVETVA
jgi:membrane-bound serine protease (ClpP class)